MKGTFILLFLLIGFICGCNDTNSKPVHIKRDTTITQENAFSELFLDSLRLERILSEQQFGENDIIRIKNFYKSRNYQFAWFTNEGLAEQARAFWNLHNNYLDLSKDSSNIDKQLHNEMELFINDEPIDTAQNSIVRTEVLLTQHFFEYAHYAYEGTIDPEELQWHIPRKKIDPLELLDSLVAKKGKNLEEWEPVNNQYKLMKKELERYYSIEKAGGWGTITPTKKKLLRLGDSTPAISQAKIRLHKSGDFKSADTSLVFTRELEEAVLQSQKRYGIAEDGVIGPDLLNNLNVTINKRIEQLLINMERMRWMPKEAVGTRIIANIPEFKVHVFEGQKKVFDIDIVVGTLANRTVIFNDSLKYVVFSPYWNIPRSIIRNEILPGIRKNSNYLNSHNMEQTGYSNGLPLIRQKPGSSNSLGKVKFIFPNSYNIYFHDTPAKSLFDRNSRAFSHGCIRLAEPKKMAEYLLSNQPQWNSFTIDEAMNSQKEDWVTLKKAVPVIISYFTAWVDGDGLLNFRDDIYGHDEKMAERLFEKG